MFILIIAVTSLISILAFYRNDDYFYGWMMRPSDVVHNQKYYQLITSGLIHGDWSHLLFNMFTLFFAGQMMEPYVGGINILIIYIASMVLADIPTVIRKKDDYGYSSLGASGAVSGILFGGILFNPLAKIYVFIIPIGIPAFLFGLLYLAWSYYAAKRGGDGINHDAHFWGAVAGVILTIVLVPDSINYFIGSFR